MHGIGLGNFARPRSLPDITKKQYVMGVNLRSLDSVPVPEGMRQATPGIRSWTAIDSGAASLTLASWLNILCLFLVGGNLVTMPHFTGRVKKH
jgi:hypothetical protein